jgi:hypothetical protein
MYKGVAVYVEEGTCLAGNLGHLCSRASVQQAEARQVSL